LKVLEYYEGILLLTTNREPKNVPSPRTAPATKPHLGPLTFDIAVHSRIHVAVEFNEMDKEMQQRTLMLFLEQIRPEQIEEDEIRRWIRTYSDDRFNARQIRNVLSAAINIARAEDSMLTYRCCGIKPRSSRESFQHTLRQFRIAIFRPNRDCISLDMWRYIGIQIKHGGGGKIFHLFDALARGK
jgi:hypothetical protein